MKAEQLEQYILLRQSGELSPDQASELEAALAENPQARQMAEDADRILDLARTPDVPPVSEFTLERILQEARSVNAPVKTSGFSPMLAIAAAVALLLAVGIGLKHMQATGGPDLAQSPEPSEVQAPIVELAALVSDEIDQEFNALQDEVSQVSDELFSDNFWGDAPADDLDSMAEELLQLESQI